MFKKKYIMINEKKETLGDDLKEMTSCFKFVFKLILLFKVTAM